MKTKLSYNTIIMDLAGIRNEYASRELDESQVPQSPIALFQNWMEDALKVEALEPTAMYLSTVSPEGWPSGRIVLLKGIEQEGFVFFTNYLSHKGQDLANNPKACLTFFWPELERQVRIQGLVEKISSEASDAYFYSRPLGSRIGATVSPQSTVIPNRAVLDEKLNALSLLPEEKITRPEHWGGYVLTPKYLEFWQGRVSRLHDRIAYTLEDQSWKCERLAP